MHESDVRGNAVARVGFVRRFLPRTLQEKGFALISASAVKVGFIPQASAGPVDFRGLEIEPAEALRRANGLRTLISVPLVNLRTVSSTVGVAYFACTRGGENPFVETVLQILDDPGLGYANSALRAFHDSFQPSTIADLFGLGANEGMHSLLSQPPLLAFPPWVPPPLADCAEHLRARQQNVTIENRSHGRNISFRDGVSGFGPVSALKGEMEIERLRAITSSIMNVGYQPFMGGEVRVIALRSRGQHRFLCAYGHHRAASLAALGHDSIPAILHPTIIDRNDIPKWPGVAASVFTVGQAERIFDMMFCARPPEAALRWQRGGRHFPGNSTSAAFSGRAPGPQEVIPPARRSIR